VFLGAMLLYFIWSVARDNFNLHELEDKVKNIFKRVNKKLDEKIIEDYRVGKEKHDLLNDEIVKKLLEENRISREMSVEEIAKEKMKFQDEENKKKLRENLKLFSNAGDEETIKIPFDNAMFLLKHYNRRTLISEDGRVVHHNLKDPDFYEDETNFYIPIEEAEKKPDEEKIQEVMLPEGNLSTVIKKDGVIYFNKGTDKEITAKNNQILTNKVLETEAERRVQNKQHKQEELSIEEAKELIENSAEKLNDKNVVTLDVLRRIHLATQTHKHLAS
jgi:hypothetical protein